MQVPVHTSSDCETSLTTPSRPVGIEPWHLHFRELFGSVSQELRGPELFPGPSPPCPSSWALKPS